MTSPNPDPEYSKTLEMWTNTDLKTQVLVFYHDNPGTIETLQGLAVRLGTNVQALRKEMSHDLIRGLFQERKVGNSTVFILNHPQEGDMQTAIRKCLTLLARSEQEKS